MSGVRFDLHAGGVNNQNAVVCEGPRPAPLACFTKKWRIQNGQKGPSWCRVFSADSENVSPKFLRPPEVPQNGNFFGEL